MMIRRPREVEAVRSGEDIFVAIDRRVPDDDLLAGADRTAAEHRVLSTGPHHMRDRADPADEFLDRARYQRRMGAQHRKLLRMLNHREHAAGDRITRGFLKEQEVP